MSSGVLYPKELVEGLVTLTSLRRMARVGNKLSSPDCESILRLVNIISSSLPLFRGGFTP